MSEEKMFKCEKCGKEKKESEGNFVLDGSAFCCEECCKKPVEGEEGKDGVCEFC